MNLISVAFHKSLLYQELLNTVLYIPYITLYSFIILHLEFVLYVITHTHIYDIISCLFSMLTIFMISHISCLYIMPVDKIK